MKKPVYLLTAGFALAALTVLQLPAAETTSPRLELNAHPTLQRTSANEGVRIITLSGSETSALSQPQRWVF
ncbi:hypothetical protein [Pseudomonas songnenensis]|uniref:Uncharacterized protein n=1 Tax=Pseudomonas songnenensis TaxID=1176259 RepID=A0A482U868_9PSED|nr:hypothetical protein [Pseudomonas songnenensis]RYJ61237.1 hypothetical protein EJA06_015180 [Pseudomonas songnenensis]